MKNLGPADVAPATSAGPCLACSSPTTNTFNLCDDCVHAATAGERDAQGLSPNATDDPSVAAWLARLLLPRRSAA